MSTEHVYKLLKNDLKHFSFSPGAPLAINRLSSAYTISAIPVREALARLSAEGHIDHHPGKSLSEESCGIAQFSEHQAD